MQTLALEKKKNSNNLISEQLQVYVETYGCQMNEYDSGVVKSILGDFGHIECKSEKAADIILINTCAVRQKAHEKIYNRLASLAYLKKRKTKLVIGILGCMAQNLGDDLFAEGLPVDFVMGPDNYKQLPQIIQDIRSGDVASINITQLSRVETYSDIEPGVVSGPLSFVTIMRGCDNFCSFCVVPYTRGRERSLEPEFITNEINNLILKNNIREVTLLGQNVNSYKHNKISFTNLIESILKNTTIDRIRFTSPHPQDFPIELLELMANEKRFCKQIHLPLQSGSTAVLDRMKRDYTQTDFLKLVDQIRKIVPGVGLSTDIITGFCGETDLEFKETIGVVKEVQFDMAYMFHYSERESTLAYKSMTDNVALQTKLDRLKNLIEVQTKISLEKNKAYINTMHEVLVETTSKRSATHLMGRNSAGKSIVFEAPKDMLDRSKELIGSFQNIKIDDCTSATLQGHIN